MDLQGVVKSGFGEGHIWVEKVQAFFKNKYNMSLFLGTLNIKLDDEFILDTDEIIPKEEYGGQFDVYTKQCKVLSHNAYILRPKKNNRKNGDHPLNIIEVVSDVNFRKEYNLKDGDKIAVEIK